VTAPAKWLRASVTVALAAAPPAVTATGAGVTASV
jgi:hypothetical protein